VVVDESVLTGVSCLERLLPHAHRPHGREHHQSLDVLDASLLEAPPQQEDSERRPSKQQESEAERNQPVKRGELVGASEDDVQGRSVDDEHAQASARDDAVEVVLVAKDLLAEGDIELGLDRKDVEALHDEDRQVDNRLRLGQSINLLLSSDGLSATVDEVRASLREIGRGFLSATKISGCEATLPEHDEVRSQASKEFDDTSLQIGVAEDLAVDQSLVLGGFHQVLPEDASEGSFDLRHVLR